MQEWHGARDTVVKDKARTFGTRRRAKPKGINGTRNQGLKKQLRPRSERTSDRIFGKTIGLEILRRTAGSSVRIRKIKD
jgi:hypothetical protein